MADFPLIVGLDVDQSYGEFQNGISALVGRLNAKPPKIKIEINKKDAESQLSSLRKEIDALGKAGGSSGFASSLTSQLNGVSANIQEIAKQLAAISKMSGGEGIANGFKSAEPVIAGLKAELNGLQEVMRNFKGLNLNLSMGGKSATQKSSQSAAAAAEGVNALMKQAEAYEKVFLRLQNLESHLGSTGVIQTLSQMKRLDLYNIPSAARDSTLSDQKRIVALREYINLMKELATLKGVDVSGIEKSFNQSADKIVSDVQKVTSGEKDLEAGLERIKSLFGSGVDAEALSKQFNAVNTSIQSVVEAINNLKPDANVFQQLTESITNVTTAINGLVTALGNVDTSSVSKVGAQVAALKQGASAKADVSFAKDLKNMTADLQTYSAKYDEVQRKFNNIKAPSAELSASYERLTQLMNTMRSTDASDQEKVAAYRQWSTALKEVDALLTSVGNAERDANKQATAQAKEAAEAERERAKAAKEAAAAEKEAAKKNRVIDPGTKEYLDNLSKIERKIAEVRQNEAKWTAARTGRTSGNYKEYVSQAAALEQLAADMRNGGLAAEEFKRRMAGIENSMTSNAAAIRGAGEATASLSDKFKGLISRVSSYFTAYQAVMYLWRGFKQAVSASIELEDAFAQLEIVTGATESEMSQFKDTAVSLATDLGKSVSDVTKSIETFSRLGYNLGDASTLAEYATILSNVAAVDTDSATTGLTSIIKGFNMDVTNAGHVADVLVEVGQKYAVSAGEMMEAYERSGAALNATNTSFEKSAGLIAAANAAVQDSSVVGTALKTVSARIRGSKADLDELGESTEDLAEGFSKYAAEIKALTGFDIMLDDHTFKDLYDIMEGVAQVWDRLSDTQQARVSEILGGTRQLQVISSILGNWKDAAGAYETALNSVGAATRANDIYMDTATAHINRMKVAFEALAQDAIRSEFLSDLADLGRHLINAADAAIKFANALGGLKPILAGVLIANLPRIGTALLNWLPAGLASTIIDVGKAFKSGSISAKSFFSIIGKGAKDAWASMSSFGKAGLIAGTVITAISLVKSAIDAYKKHLEDARNAEVEAGKTATNEAKNLAELYSAYRDANAAYDGSINSKNALSSASANLAKALGVEESAVNDLKDSYQELTLEQLRAAEMDAKAAIIAARENLTHALDGKDYATERESVVGLRAIAMGRQLGSGDVKRDAETILMVYRQLIEERDELIRSGKEESESYKYITLAIDGLRPSVESLNSAEADLNEIMNLIGDTALGMSDSLDQVGNAVTKASGSFKDMFSGGISEGIDNVQNRISTLSDALAKLRSGSMDAGSVIDLLQQFPELAEYVDITSDGFGNLDAALQRAIADAPEDLIETLKQFKQTHDLTEAQVKQIDSLSDSLRNLPKDSVQSLSEEFGVLADNIRRAGEERTELEKKLSEDDYDKGYDERAKNFEAYQKVLDEGEYGSKAFAAYSEYFGLMEKTTDEIDAWMAANKKYFAEGQDGIIAWTETLSDLTKSGALEGIASYNEETGLFTYDVTKLDEFAEKLGWTEGMLQDFISKYRMYVSDWQNYSGTDLRNMFTDAGLIGGAAEGSVVSMARLMEYTGKTKQEVQEMIDLINQDQPDSWLKGIDDSFLKTFSDQGFSSSMEGIKTDMMQLKSVIQGLGIDWNEFIEDGFSNFETTLQPILEGIGWTDEMITALRDQLVDPFVVAFSTIGTDSLSDVIAKLHNYNIDVTVNDDGALVVTQGLVDSLYEATGNAQSTIDLIDQLAARDDVEVEADLKIGDSNINDLIGAESGVTTITVDLDINGETVRADITALASDVQEILGDAGTIDLTAEDVDATTKTQLVKTLIDGLVNNGNPYVAYLDTDTGDSVTSLDDVLNRINSILNSKDSKTLTVTTHYKTIGTPPGLLGGLFGGFATGTRRAPSGPALLGDEYSPTGEPKPELVVSKNGAYIAGINGPVVSNLNAGDVVYTADETKKILKGSNIVRLPAFAGGTANGLKKTGSSGTSVASYSGASSKSTSAAAKEAAKEVSDELEEQLKELKDKIDDILAQFEFDIFMAEQHNASSEEIIAIYKRMQQTVHEQAEKYRKMGVDENNEYIRDLKKQWWEYEESIREVRKKEFDEWVKDSQFAIEVMEHDDEGVDKILDSWRTILRSINDEIAYYSARGYDIASDEIQDLMKEAWDAEEQIEEILDKVLDKVNGEIDHIQDVFKTFQSAADEWNESQYLTLDTLQEIIDVGIEYMTCLEVENDQLVINRETVAKLLSVKAQELAVEGALNYVRKLGNALTEGNTEELNRLLTATSDTTDATWQLVYANLAFLDLTDKQYEAALKNINYLRSIANNVSNNILNSLKDEGESASESIDNASEALEKVIDYTKDLIKHEHEEMKDALDDQLDMYKKIVDEKKKSLDLTKSELSYNKDISNRTAEIAKLQAQADALALDDSRDAQIKRAKILEEIAKKQEELEEKQRDHSIDLQKEALDKRVEVFEDAINDQKEDIDKEISSEEKLYQLAIKRLENSDWEELYNQLIAWNTEYGNSLNDEITEAWNKATEAVKEYGSVVEALKMLGKVEDPESPSSTTNDVISPYTVNESDDGGVKGIIDSMQQNSARWFLASTQEERDSYERQNADLAKQLEELGLYRKDGVWYRKDGSIAYTLTDKERDAIKKAVAEKMKANSIAWWTASDDERKALAEENRFIAGSNKLTQNSKGEWVDADGNTLYTISSQEKEAIAKQLVSMMKQNSNAWAGEDANGRQRLANENVRLASSVASLLGAKVTRDDNGVWYINGEKLYDKYHSGGIVGGGSVKDNERFALLKDGEMVLSDTQKKTLEHLLAVGQMLRDKSSLLADSVFGGMVNNIAASSMKGIRNQLPGDLNKPTQIVQVDASLTVSGAVDDDVLRVIKRHPNFVAEQVAKVII